MVEPEDVKKQKRVSMQIDLNAAAAKSLRAESDRLGLPQKELASRLLVWFAEQPDYVRATILNIYPPSIAQDIGLMVMQKLAGQQQPDVGSMQIIPPQGEAGKNAPGTSAAPPLQHGQAQPPGAMGAPGAKAKSPGDRG